jgi:hypothetical protein
MTTMQGAPETETETETETQRDSHPLDQSLMVPAHRALGAEDTPRSRPMYMPRRGVIPGDLRLEDSGQSDYLHWGTPLISTKAGLLGSLIGEGGGGGGGGGGGRLIEGALAALRRQELSATHTHTHTHTYTHTYTDTELSAGTRGLDTAGWGRERLERRDFEMQAMSLFSAPNTPQGPSTGV